MDVQFVYNKDKDVWCLLNKGKSSNNSSKSTKVYDQLVVVAGENPTEIDVGFFVDTYIKDSNIDVNEYIEKYRREWNGIEREYHKRAMEIFGVVLPQNITVYLTINSRCPYNILENFFFVSFPSASVRATIMHELWHFYTWYAFGHTEEERLGKERYNELKEALTVLLDVECGDLFPENQKDKGYAQHAALRDRILEAWSYERNIGKLWASLAV